MTLKELETRLITLEEVVAKLVSQLDGRNGTSRNEMDPAKQKHWWRESAGAFKDDPGFDELVRLSREYRESLHPDRRTKVRRKGKMKNAGS